MPKKNKHQKLLVATCGRVPLSTSSVEEQEGVKVQRYRKDLIREGLFVHPMTGQELNVTPERMERWVKAFAQMTQNGVDIEVKADHSYSAWDVVGYAKDLYAEEDDGVKTLFAIIELRGDEGINLAETVKNVSAEIEDFTDGEGNGYGEAITGIAICQLPVIPGQKAFEKIEASRGGADAIPFVMSKETDYMDNETLEKIKKIVGGEEEVTEENAMELLLSRVEELSKAKTDLEEKVEELSSKKADEGSDDRRGGETAMDSDLAEEVAMSQAERIEALMEQGKISKKQKEMCMSLLGEEGKRNTVYLSAKRGVGGKSVVSHFIDVLKEGQLAVELSTKTGVQSLSHKADKGGEDVSSADDVAKQILEKSGYEVR